MRIAYVCADAGVPPFGKKGCSVHVQEILRGFRRRDVRVDLFASRLNEPVPQGLEEVRRHMLDGPRSGDLATRELGRLRTNRQLDKALQQAAPFDFIYERYSLWSFAAMRYAHRRRIPAILEVNSPLVEEQERHRGLAHRQVAERVRRFCMDRATAVVAVSDEVAEHLIQVGASKHKIHVIPNGVRLERFSNGLQPTCSALAGCFVIGFVGTLKPWHGVETLLQAFAALHRVDAEARLLVVGDGPEGPRLHDLTERLFGPTDHPVIFTGAVDPERIPGLLASMDVAVAPYPQLRDYYFSPLKLFEYMAAGRPIVASRIGQIETVIQHKTNGLLYEPGRTTELTKMLAALRQDVSLRRRLGESARRTVAATHTWDAVVDRILSLCCSRFEMSPFAPRL